jgi:hypothetical protein
LSDQRRIRFNKAAKIQQGGARHPSFFVRCLEAKSGQIEVPGESINLVELGPEILPTMLPTAGARESQWTLSAARFSLLA